MPNLQAGHEEEYFHLQSVLNSISTFVDHHPSSTYIEFDYFIAHDLTLFFIEPDLNFQKIEETLELIRKSLPAMKRVFAKPIIALKDSPEVLPVELVNKTNQDTLFHLANHLNDIGNIKNERIKPRRLLTQIYEDDYAIYENIVFDNFVDEVLKYCRRNIRFLNNLLYANDVMEFNLLERVNHIDYYMALGKLHTGYIRDYSRYYDVARKLYNECVNIVSVLSARLKRPIYSRIKKRNHHLKLKKTNIFLNQKDYRRVFLTYKYFITHKLISVDEEEVTNLSQLKKNYFLFVKILSIFSLGHFGFETRKESNINLARLKATFTCKKWKVQIRSVDGRGILFSIAKDREYNILLLPSLDPSQEKKIAELQENYHPDEILFASPLEEVINKRDDTLFLSMENIDSFRRIQQFILRGMIYADTERKDCPFCPKDLIYDKKKKAYICPDCRTEIYEDTCPDHHQSFFYTKISNYKAPKLTKSSLFDYRDWFYHQKVEASYNFRNITKMDNSGDVICPVCHQIHHKESK